MQTKQMLAPDVPVKERVRIKDLKQDRFFKRHGQTGLFFAFHFGPFIVVIPVRDGGSVGVVAITDRDDSISKDELVDVIDQSHILYPIKWVNGLTIVTYLEQSSVVPV